MDYTLKLTIAFLLITATLASLFLTIALRRLCDALEMNFEREAEDTREIRKKIAKLEESVGVLEENVLIK